MDWDGATFWTYLVDPRITQGALVTLGVATLAQSLATVAGFGLAIFLRSGSRTLAAFARAFVWLFRGTPPLVQLLLLYFGLPEFGLRLTVFEAGIAGLSLYAAAYMAEVFRAALSAVDAGQAEAAHAVGLTRVESMWFIVLPQAIRIALPPFGNEFTSMMRTTSLLSVISFEELLRVTTQIINQTFRPLELYAVAALYYLAMTTAWLLIQSLLERRFAIARPEALRAIPLAD